eukprot:scaffold473_cov156-Amphora_coffeaeformis.AAC.4
MKLVVNVQAHRFIWLNIILDSVVKRNVHVHNRSTTVFTLLRPWYTVRLGTCHVRLLPSSDGIGSKFSHVFHNTTTGRCTSHVIHCRT